MCFSKVKHYFGHISGMVGPIEVKRKGSASVGYWVQYMTLTFDLTHDLDLGCFTVKFRNSSISGIVGLIDVKWKQNELIWYWADCMTLPFDHTHDLDRGVEIWRSKSEIVTMVGWADVPDSDWGDFRCWRAVDISSCICMWLAKNSCCHVYACDWQKCWCIYSYHWNTSPDILKSHHNMV